MIPPFDRNGNLPPGHHTATFEEVLARYNLRNNTHRAKRSKALSEFYDFVKSFALDLYIDGSYITSKKAPGDVDLILVLPDDFNPNSTIGWKLASFIARDNNHDKDLHIFNCKSRGDPSLAHLIGWFTRDRDNNQKGIIRVRIR